MLVLLPEPEELPEDVPPEVPPALEPLPVVIPSSFRHFSRSLPAMPRHLLLLVLPEALLPAVLGELVLGEAALGALVLGELVLGELLPVDPVALLPDAPPDE